ncbi:glutamate cyclase domain-containing protein [Cupriavidus sp. PET2-C1]
MTTSTSKVDLAAFDDRLDKLVSLDIGGRGVEHLHAAARSLIGKPLVGAAADALAAVPKGSTVLVTTGSVSRAWISPSVGENDGPAGAAAIVRALSLAKQALCVVLAEATLLDSLGAVLTSAGLTVLPIEQARIASKDGSLAVVSLQAFPVEDDEAKVAATQVLDELKPVLFFSTERVGRNEQGIYHSMRGIDYGMKRARIDFVFDEAIKRGIPTVAVGDGGNEIGMGLIAEAVRKHVKFGDKCACECGAGIGAVTGADVLVTAACSNWGCYAIAAALAMRQGDARLLHTPELEAELLRRGVDVGLINSVVGIIDPNVDGIPVSSHLAMVEMLRAIVRPVVR